MTEIPPSPEGEWISKLGAEALHKWMKEQEQEEQKPTYRIIKKGEAILCLKCSMVSYHPKDMEHKYCGNCHEFHEV